MKLTDFSQAIGLTVENIDESFSELIIFTFTNGDVLEIRSVANGSDYTYMLINVL